MATKTPMADASPVQPTHQNTQIDQLVLRHKAPVVTVLVLVFGLIAAFGAYMYMKGQKAEVADKAIYEFSANGVEKYQANELTKVQLMEQVSKLQAAVGDYPGAVAPLLQAVDALIKNNEMAEAREVLAWIRNRFKQSEIAFFSGIRLAAVEEDLGHYDQATTVLEELAQGSFKVFEDKLHLDLGRLYLKQDKKDQAKTHFQFVLEKSQEAEFKKLAELYLQQIGS